MQLSFRGTKYNYHPILLEVAQASLQGTYRGLPCRVHHYRQPLYSRPISQTMTYRGVTYQQG